MTRLVVCCDGTWNTAEQERGGVPTPTNVVRIYNTLLDGPDQKRYYHPGVGTDGGMFDHLRGGAVGAGLAANIKSAYAWLAREYAPGDSIHLFGFSRGAYTVRSLGGMLGACGLLSLDGPPGRAEWAEIDRLYEEVYRPVRGRGAGHVPPYDPVEIAFLGVWDTVGALGVPDQFGILNLFEVDRRHKFDDTRLGRQVRHARHALALDETRAPFLPTLWANAAEVHGSPGRTARQMWFAGNHSGVGGGYAECGLSDLSLRWMVEEAQAVTDLAFHKGMVDQIRDNGQVDVLHDSCTGVYKIIGPVPRAVPPLDGGPVDGGTTGMEVHPSVLLRRDCPPISAAPYRPSLRLGVGESASRAVYAREPWNATGLWLEPGEYHFAAAGEWLDGSMPVGPGGAADGKFHRGEVKQVIGTAMGWLQDRFRELTDNDAATFVGARRCSDVAWMSLIGAVAAEELDDDGVQLPYENLLIGEGGRFRVRLAGYLYAFANDAWAFYGDNRGSVELTVARIS